MHAPSLYWWGFCSLNARDYLPILLFLTFLVSFPIAFALVPPHQLFLILWLHEWEPYLQDFCPQSAYSNHYHSVHGSYRLGLGKSPHLFDNHPWLFAVQLQPDQSSISSIPDYPSFIKYFLDIYTSTSTIAFKACNATTQGKLTKFEAYPLQ